MLPENLSLGDILEVQKCRPNYPTLRDHFRFVGYWEVTGGLDLPEAVR